MRGSPDDLFARNAKMLNAGFIDQNIATAVHVFHGDRGGHVLDDLVQKLPITCDCDPELKTPILYR